MNNTEIPKHEISAEVKTSLVAELKDVNTRLEGYTVGLVTGKEKAQVKNLIDKIENRKLLPDFTIELPNGKDKVQTVTLSEFLKGIKIDIPEDKKDLIRKTEQRKKALELLL